ncbi:hypothetical protein AGDE_16634 [Angomonas deanei]|uniref:Uncharacterized protein n=1 Tax=Angomonas deanei TaxID=59799 RepID=A0A7G2C1U8_9TRYP|nr:hypothetical protein AGDE_16634 [Angomonas deanei]CAD2213606.1 hypothetical protein, conserved [Angomonas deanei]|eukprot:EPY16731.1 hypothetical protein AGDE_16634 [Angomonas deanei]
MSMLSGSDYSLPTTPHAHSVTSPGDSTVFKDLIFSVNSTDLRGSGSRDKNELAAEFTTPQVAKADEAFQQLFLMNGKNGATNASSNESPNGPNDYHLPACFNTSTASPESSFGDLASLHSVGEHQMADRAPAIKRKRWVSFKMD